MFDTRYRMKEIQRLYIFSAFLAILFFRKTFNDSFLFFFFFASLFAIFLYFWKGRLFRIGGDWIIVARKKFRFFFLVRSIAFFTITIFKLFKLFQNYLLKCTFIHCSLQFYRFYHPYHFHPYIYYRKFITIPLSILWGIKLLDGIFENNQSSR